MLSYEFCRIFRSIYFVEHLWTHTCVKWSNEKLFSRKYIFTEKHWWGCHLKYSCKYEGLEFYLKGKYLKKIGKKVDSNILRLRSIQQTKQCLVEVVTRKCSAKKVPWNVWRIHRKMFGKIHRKTLVQKTFLK